MTMESHLTDAELRTMVVQQAARLDKMARVINNLRRRLEALEGGVSDPSDTQPQHGVFRMPSTCAVCGKDKGPSRARALTCKPCGKARDEFLHGNGGDRETFTRDTCHSCGVSFGRTTRFLCAPCGTGFKAWKGGKH